MFLVVTLMLLQTSSVTGDRVEKSNEEVGVTNRIDPDPELVRPWDQKLRNLFVDGGRLSAEPWLLSQCQDTIKIAIDTIGNLVEQKLRMHAPNFFEAQKSHINNYVHNLGQRDICGYYKFYAKSFPLSARYSQPDITEAQAGHLKQKGKHVAAWMNQIMFNETHQAHQQQLFQLIKAGEDFPFDWLDDETAREYVIYTIELMGRQGSLFESELRSIFQKGCHHFVKDLVCGIHFMTDKVCQETLNLEEQEEFYERHRMSKKRYAKQNCLADGSTPRQPASLIEIALMANSTDIIHMSY
eukprot:gnl/TRDRNA2_/TRDRNA2_196345_c0_seq1.p1 gnl/TRDRNA2_/TRDRNA2_196345_c0~~gnl/TRDRNA2_/TRDRNA2_196345_c0_seq1.p1  ORF type:complete len:298 (+),score=42.86 gnl/TRDRNA2_/TRDRNA2_196345_c0_seq1:70-963(+)